MNISESRTKLVMISKGIAIDWERTRDSWRDAKCREFEENYIVPLQQGVESAMTTMEELDKILRKIHKDCE